MIQIREIADKATWEKFNLASRNPSFLQSWSWGQFQKSLNRKIYRLGIYESRKLSGISLLMIDKSKVASFLYCPGGPVFTNWKKEYFDPWLDFVHKIAEEKTLSFLRVDPRNIEEGEESLLDKLGFLHAPEYTQPQCSAVLDLSKSEQELLSAMSNSTRYNIGASQRKGVKVREGNPSEIKVFSVFLKETAKRKNLTLPHEEAYHQKQFEALNKDGFMTLFLAEKGNQPLAAALVGFYADTAYYLHAANSFQQRNLRASYPLVWQVVLEGKKRNLKKFDFWGVAENDDPSHSWAGVTTFKLSFSAERECYTLPFDLPYSSSYQFSRVVETWRKSVRKILRFGR